MTIVEFEIKLESMQLSKKGFSLLTNLPYQTIMNWKHNGNVPVWVESWLENYIKAKSYNEMKETVYKVEGLN